MAPKKKRKRARWTSLICIPFILYVLGNIFFHARISNVEREVDLAPALPRRHNTNRDEQIKAALPPPPPIEEKIAEIQHHDSVPMFSREPLLQKGCELQFVDQTMAFCYMAGTLEQELSPKIGNRLLEYHYHCSSKTLSIINVNQESRIGRKCLWIESSSHAQPGDIVWGSGSASSSSPVNPLLLVGDVFQDYYWLPTANTAKKTHFFQGQRCLIDDAAQPASCPFGKRKCDNVRLSTTAQHCFSFLEQLRLCDTVVSSNLPSLILADSLGIPNAATKSVNEEEYHDYVKTTNRTTDAILGPLSKQQRSELSATIADSFPYLLVEIANEDVMEDARSSKTLVIIMGSLRGGDVTWNSFYKHMLDLNSADLALVVGTLPEEKRNSSLVQRAKYLYEFPEFNDWGDAVDSIHGSNQWRELILPHANDKWGTWGGVADKPGSGAVIFMIRWYVAKFLVENGMLEKYDRFVLTRSDHYYGCAHDLSVLDSNYMWVPWGEDYKFGITDRHLVCNRAQILKALDIYPPIVRHPKKYASPQFADLNPEQLLRARWEQESLWPWVRRFDRVMFTCAVDGDKTRWTEKSVTQTREGVFLKYEFEYEETTCICKTGPCNFPYTRRKMRVGYPQRDQKLL